MLTLVRLTGPNKGEKLQLDGALIRIGRARGNHVCFDRERERVVGNNHAEIRLEEGGLVLYDLQSTHGTFVNDQRVTRWRLQEGDIIGLAQQMGGPTLRFTRRSEESSLPRSEVRATASGVDRPVESSAQPWPGNSRGDGPQPGNSSRAGGVSSPVGASMGGPAGGAGYGQSPAGRDAVPVEQTPPRALARQETGAREPSRAPSPSTRLLDSREGIDPAFQRGPGAPTRELSPGDAARSGRPPLQESWQRGPAGSASHSDWNLEPYSGLASPSADDKVEAGRSRSAAQSTSVYLEVPSLPPNVARGGAWQPAPGSGNNQEAHPSAHDIAQRWVARLSELGRVTKSRLQGLAGGAWETGLMPGRGKRPPKSLGLDRNARGGATVTDLRGARTDGESQTQGRASGSSATLAGRQSRVTGAGLEHNSPLPEEAPAWAVGSRRPKVQEFIRQRAAAETFAPGIPQAAQEDEGEPIYPRRFVLEEAIKEKERPEWIWVRQHRLLLLTMAVTAVMAWLYADQGAVWLAARRVGPVPMIEARSMDEPLVDPPGARNPELVRLVVDLDQRVRSLPPQKMDSGDATLRSLRAIVRAAGEDSEFIPIDFSQQVDEEIKTLKKQRGFEFTYQRSLKQRPEIERMLEAAHLPTFLSFIPWVESDYSPAFTDNREGRAGLWGLTVETARRHGLTVSRERDERRDWKLETTAASSYLIELVGETRGQSFAMAAAAFHRGPKAARSMLAERSAWKPEEVTFWQFYRERYVPLELIHFLARVMGAAVIAENPERFGLPPAGEP